MAAQPPDAPDGPARQPELAPPSPSEIDPLNPPSPTGRLTDDTPDGRTRPHPGPPLPALRLQRGRTSPAGRSPSSRGRCWRNSIRSSPGGSTTRWPSSSARPRCGRTRAGPASTRSSWPSRRWRSSAGSRIGAEGRRELRAHRADPGSAGPESLPRRRGRPADGAGPRRGTDIDPRERWSVLRQEMGGNLAPELRPIRVAWCIPELRLVDNEYVSRVETRLVVEDGTPLDELAQAVLPDNWQRCNDFFCSLTRRADRDAGCSPPATGGDLRVDRPGWRGVYEERVGTCPTAGSPTPTCCSPGAKRRSRSSSATSSHPAGATTARSCGSTRATSRSTASARATRCRRSSTCSSTTGTSTAAARPSRSRRASSAGWTTRSTSSPPAPGASGQPLGRWSPPPDRRRRRTARPRHAARPRRVPGPHRRERDRDRRAGPPERQPDPGR